MSDIEELGKKSLEMIKKIYANEHLREGNERGEIKCAGKDWIAIDVKSFPYTFLKAMEEVAGEDIAADCLFEPGYLYGKEVTEKYKKKGIKAEALFKLSVCGGTFFGWLVPEFIKITPEENICRIYNSFEARSYLLNNKEKSKKPVCHWLRGVGAGICTVAFESEFEVKETKCFAKGDKYCEFVATPKKIPEV